MFCTRCGVRLDGAARFCSSCGARTGLEAPAGSEPRRLMRSRRNKRLGGVCGGMAEYFDLDATLIRLLWIAFLILPLPGAILAYIVAWIVIPAEPDYVVWAAPAPKPAG